MRKLYEKVKKKLINFIKWLWRECKDWRTLILFCVVCATIGLPVWLGYLLFVVFAWKWTFVVATAMWAFWMLPGAPFLALSLSVTLAIKRIYQKRQKIKRRSINKNLADQTNDGQYRDQ